MRSPIRSLFGASLEVSSFAARIRDLMFGRGTSFATLWPRELRSGTKFFTYLADGTRLQTQVLRCRWLGKSHGLTSRLPQLLGPPIAGRRSTTTFTSSEQEFIFRKINPKLCSQLRSLFIGLSDDAFQKFLCLQSFLYLSSRWCHRVWEVLIVG